MVSDDALVLRCRSSTLRGMRPVRKLFANVKVSRERGSVKSSGMLPVRLLSWSVKPTRLDPKSLIGEEKSNSSSSYKIVT